MYEGVIAYTGNKSKLIPMLNELFSESKATRLIDCCCGGLSVTLHSNFKNVLANDTNSKLIELYKHLSKSTLSEVLEYVQECIHDLDLNKHNEDSYKILRNVYNSESSPHPLALYVLHCYSFSNMIRFNKKGQFNSPFGKREFNDNSINKLKDFYCITKAKNIEYSNTIFENLKPTTNDLVYIDPPYLITEAVYNNGWDDNSDIKMMEWLDSLHQSGIQFAMSNVTHHRGKVNQALIDWSLKYRVIEKDHKYVSNAYHAKDMNEKTVEVLITNVGMICH